MMGDEKSWVENGSDVEVLAGCTEYMSVSWRWQTGDTSAPVLKTNIGILRREFSGMKRLAVKLQASGTLSNLEMKNMSVVG